MLRRLTPFLLSALLAVGSSAYAQSSGPPLPIPIPTNKGGTGAVLTPVAGDLLAATSATAFGRIAAPAVGQVLKSNGVGVAPSWSGTLNLSGNGALSAPVFTGTGTWITGGTATTTKPYALIEPTGTTSTGWSTAGTGLGVNAATGFTGNLIDAQLNGVLKFRVASTGNMRLGGTTYDWVFDGNTSPAQMTISANGVGVGGAINDQGFKALSYQMSSSLAATVDANISRISAGVIGVGTGTQGSVAGGLQAATLALSGGITTSNLTNTQNQSTISGLKLGSDGNGQVIDSTAANWSLWRGGQAHVYFYGSNTQLLTQVGLGGAQQTPLSYFTAPAAANFQHGAADAASPVAQTIKFQDVVAGTSNTAGVNATIQAPAGTGTGAGGSLIFQVAPAGSSGSAKNAWQTALTIDSNRLATFASGVNATILQTSYINNTSNTRTYWTFPASAESAVFITGGTNPLLQFGGTTSSFVAARRNGTTLEVKLADNSAFTAIQGKLTTDTAYTAGDPTTTGYLLVYDSTGTAYRVPALLN